MQATQAQTISSPLREPRKLMPWIVAAILALLVHLAILLPKIPGLLFDTTPVPPPRVDLKNLDAKELQKIRNQWRAREKALLLDKNLKSPTASEAPDNARYMSDRNIRVEKEQKAKQTTVIPKAGAPGEPSAASQPAQPVEPAQPAQPRDAAKPKHRLPQIGNLGVPLPAAPKRAPRPPQQRPSQTRDAAGPGGEDGGSQYIRDPNLPEGAENMLNAEQSVFYSFYSRLYESLGPVWQSRTRALLRAKKFRFGEFITTVDAVLDEQGSLLDVHITQSSGVPEFDGLAVSSWRKIARLPNPPRDLLDAQNQVHVGFSFTIHINAQTGGVDVLPPEQVY